MSRAVLISIRPEWCGLIAGGKKTAEVRKTRPRLEMPFKCYIYQTKKHLPGYMAWGGKPADPCGVIGEFVCSEIDRLAKVGTSHSDVRYRPTDQMLRNACLSYEELCDYGGGGVLYFWNISQLKIYDKPRSLQEFRRHCVNDLWCESCAMYSTNRETCNNASVQITRPPQSWCYVEDQPY